MESEFARKIGEITGYAIELGDSVTTLEAESGEHAPQSGVGRTVGLRIDRRESTVTVVGSPGDAVFDVRYTFRISANLPVDDEEIREHTGAIQADVGRDEVVRTLRKQKLERIDDGDVQAATEAVQQELRSAESSVSNVYFSEARDLWDGFVATTRLYPFDDRFGLREYDEAVVRVIDDGRPIAAGIYGELDELGPDAAPTDPRSDVRHDRTYQ
jgi:hypothetical protein